MILEERCTYLYINIYILKIYYVLYIDNVYGIGEFRWKVTFRPRPWEFFVINIVNFKYKVKREIVCIIIM